MLNHFQEYLNNKENEQLKQQLFEKNLKVLKNILNHLKTFIVNLIKKIMEMIILINFWMDN